MIDRKLIQWSGWQGRMAAHLTLRHRGFDRVARFEETFQFHHVEAEKKNIVDNFCLILFQSRGVCLYMYIYNIHVQMQMNTHGSNHIYIYLYLCMYMIYTSCHLPKGSLWSAKCQKQLQERHFYSLSPSSDREITVKYVWVNYYDYNS